MWHIKSCRNAKNCPFLPQETLFTAFLSRMSRESQHTRFEDQILGQVSLWGRPASCASLAVSLPILTQMSSSLSLEQLSQNYATQQFCNILLHFISCIVEYAAWLCVIMLKWNKKTFGAVTYPIFALITGWGQGQICVMLWFCNVLFCFKTGKRDTCLPNWTQ